MYTNLLICESYIHQQKELNSLGMDFVHKFKATIDYQIRVVRFQLPNEIGYKLAGRGSIQRRHIISNLKVNKMLSKLVDILLLGLVLFKKLNVLVQYSTWCCKSKNCMCNNCTM